MSPLRTENDARCTMHDDSAFVNATSGLLIRNPLSRRDPQPIIDSLYIRSAEDLCRYNSSRSQTLESHQVCHLGETWLAELGTAIPGTCLDVRADSCSSQKCHCGVRFARVSSSLSGAGEWRQHVGRMGVEGCLENISLSLHTALPGHLGILRGERV